MISEPDESTSEPQSNLGQPRSTPGPDRYASYRKWLLVSNVFCFGGEQTALLIAAFLIFRETHSAIFVGLIIVAYNVPQVLLAGAANALSARWGAVRACCILHGAEMVSALVVAGAAFAHHLSVPVLLSWVTVLGISEGLNSPNPPLIRLEMVPPDYWLEYNGSRTQSIVIGTIGGILLSGVIYGLLGPGWVFVINAVGLVPMIVLYWMFGRTTPELTVVTDEVGTLREGWHYLRSEPGSWAALRLVILAFFLSGYVVLLPTIASGIGSRPEILSILEAGTVVGGLLVAICVKYLHRRVGWSRVRMFCSVSAGLLLGLIAMAESFFGTRSALASVLMAVAIIPVGFAILMNSTVLISGMQLVTPLPRRAATYTILEVTPLVVVALSQEFVGFLADEFSVPAAFGILALITLGVELLVSHRPMGHHLQALDGMDGPPAAPHRMRHGKSRDGVGHHRYWPAVLAVAEPPTRPSD